MTRKDNRAGASRILRALPLAAAGCVLSLPYRARACTACYGQSDSPLAAGMNWGILSLLVLIVLVLGGVAGFFVYLARRSRGLALVAEQQVFPGFSDAEVVNRRGDVHSGAANLNRTPAHRGGMPRPTCLSGRLDRL